MSTDNKVKQEEPLYFIPAEKVRLKPLSKKKKEEEPEVIRPRRGDKNASNN